jgi:hypothetical protein
MIRPHQNVIARYQVHDPQKRRGWHVAGQATDDARFEVDDHGIAKALRHESDVLVVRGDVRTLPEVGKNLNVGGQVIEWIARLPLGRHGNEEN